MTLTVKTTRNEYAFDGPFSVTSNLKDQSGVYLVTTKAPNGKHDVIDVGGPARSRTGSKTTTGLTTGPNRSKRGSLTRPSTVVRRIE